MKKFLSLAVALIMVITFIGGCKKASDDGFSAVTEEEKKYSKMIKDASSETELEKIESDLRTKFYGCTIGQISTEDEVKNGLRLINLKVELQEKLCDISERNCYEVDIFVSLCDAYEKMMISYNDKKIPDCTNIIDDAYTEFSERMYNAYTDNGKMLEEAFKNEDYAVIVKFLSDIDSIYTPEVDINAKDGYASIRRYELRELIKYSDIFTDYYDKMVDKYVEYIGDSGDVNSYIENRKKISELSKYIGSCAKEWDEIVKEAETYADDEAKKMLESDFADIVSKFEKSYEKIDRVIQGLNEDAENLDKTRDLLKSTK